MATPQQARPTWLDMNRDPNSLVFNPQTMAFNPEAMTSQVQPTQRGMNVANQMQQPSVLQQPGLSPNPMQSVPTTQQLIAELTANRNLARDQQSQGIKSTEDLLKEHLSNSQKDMIDLSPILALTDAWTGSKLAKSYQKPTDSKSYMETTAALQNLLQKSRNALTDDEQNFLFSQLSLLRKEDDASLREQLARDKMANQKEIAAMGAGKQGGVSLTPGEKTVDVKFADDYNKWTSGGKESALSNLERLKEAQKEIRQAIAEGDQYISGRVVGALPDIARPEKSRALQQKVQESALSSLKDTLGSQFTENEGKKILAMAYDPTLSPEENVKKVDRAVSYIMEKIAATEDKAGYFQGSGTLQGYKPRGLGSVSKKPLAPSTGGSAETPNPAALTREQKIKLLQERAARGK